MRRLRRASVESRFAVKPWLSPDRIPAGTVPADPAKLVHDNTYGPRPLFYVDRSFTCVDCGVSEIWTATQQKWWYEEAKGKIDSRANRCRACRRRRRLRRSQERRVHIEGLIEKYGAEETAYRLGMTMPALLQLCARWEPR